MHLCSGLNNGTEIGPPVTEVVVAVNDRRSRLGRALLESNDRRHNSFRWRSKSSPPGNENELIMSTISNADFAMAMLPSHWSVTTAPAFVVPELS
jgi:hypothetical protein